MIMVGFILQFKAVLLDANRYIKNRYAWNYKRYFGEKLDGGVQLAFFLRSDIERHEIISE